MRCPRPGCRGSIVRVAAEEWQCLTCARPWPPVQPFTDVLEAIADGSDRRRDRTLKSGQISL